MTGTTKAILSLSVLLLAALVVYYGMTPPQESNYISVDVPSHSSSIDDAVFGGDPYEKAQALNLLTAMSEQEDAPTHAPVSSELREPPAPEFVEVVEKVREPIVVKSVEPEFYLYTVREGETLGEIASNEMGGFSKWKQLSEFNSISDPSAIRAGRVLRIPASTTIATPIESVGIENKNVDLVQYIIQDGDTLSSIAESHYGDASLYRVILDANPTLDSRRMKIGKTIMIPKI